MTTSKVRFRTLRTSTSHCHVRPPHACAHWRRPSVECESRLASTNTAPSSLLLPAFASLTGLTHVHRNYNLVWLTARTSAQRRPGAAPRHDAADSSTRNKGPAGQAPDCLAPTVCHPATSTVSGCGCISLLCRRGLHTPPCLSWHPRLLTLLPQVIVWIQPQNHALSSCSSARSVGVGRANTSHSSS